MTKQSVISKENLRISAIEFLAFDYTKSLIRRNNFMFKKAELEIYELDLADIIVTSDFWANLDDEDDMANGE